MSRFAVVGAPDDSEVQIVFRRALADMAELVKLLLADRIRAELQKLFVI